MKSKPIYLHFPVQDSPSTTSVSRINQFSLLKAHIYTIQKVFLKEINLFTEAETIIQEPNSSIFLIRQENHSFKISEEAKLMFFNNSVEEVLNNFISYQETIYHKAGLIDIYQYNCDEIVLGIKKLIFKKSQRKYSKYMHQITNTLDSVLKNGTHNFMTKSTHMTIRGAPVNSLVNYYKSQENDIICIFEAGVKKHFGYTLSNIFTLPYHQKISDMLRDQIVVELLYDTYTKNHISFMSGLSKNLDFVFQSYFITGDIELFDVKILETKENIATLLAIVLLTDFQEPDEEKDELYATLLEKFYNMFMGPYAEEFPEIGNSLVLMRKARKDIEAKNQKMQALSYYRNKLSQILKEPQNLFALMSLFLAFNFISGEKFEKSYNCQTRYMLKNIFRNINNGACAYTNFQILCSMENLIMKYAENEKLASKQLLSSKSLVVRNVLQDIRNTTITSFSDHNLHQDQLKKLEQSLDVKLKKPEKFFFEKVSDPSVSSKSIIICISGWTSEDALKTKEWRHVSDAYPDTEVIAVNWKANAIMAIGKSIWGSMKEGWKESGLFKGLAKSGNAVFNSTKEAWDVTYQEASVVGIYLAHFLAETDLFKGYVVSMMAFSLGTLVVMSCVWELERMKRRDILYDVLVMGGVAPIGSFQDAKFAAVGNRLINVYSDTDFILKYGLFKFDSSIDPIGLKPVLGMDNKIVNIDLTNYATGHAKYRGMINEILARTDFNEDFEYMIKE